VPDAPLPPLPPGGQARWRTAVDDLKGRVPPRALLALSRGPARVLVATGLLAGALVLAIVLARLQASPAPATLPPAVPASPEPAAPFEPAASNRRDGPAEVVVDVAGAVARPGLVRLAAGSRVADALAAAGGPAPDASLPGLNQARVLGDGEQVRVPRVGEPAPSVPSPASTPGSASGIPAAPVDLNRATAPELDTLPGVGPATAAAILAWRDENGGFRRVEDLLEVPGIGPARLERLRPHVRV